MNPVTNIAEAVKSAFTREEQHAKLSPSASSRWLRCTASPEHNIGDDGSSVYTDEGTAAHTLAAFALEENRNAADYAGQTIPVLDGDGNVRREFTVTPEMATYVQVYLDCVRDQVHANAVLLVEKRVSTGVKSSKYGEITGTADAIVLDAQYGMLTVNDLKYGKGVKVDAAYVVNSPDEAAGPCVKVEGVYWEINPQAALYALGAFMDYGWLAPIKLVHVGIHQPRLDHYSVATITVQDLLAWAQGHLSAQVREIDTAPQYRPSNEGCRWCAHKAACGALEQFTIDTTTGDFPTIGQPIASEPLAVAAAYERVELVKQWLAAVEAKAKELADRGEMPGWKYVQTKKGNRVWKDAKVVEQIFKNTYRMSDDEAFKPRALISPTDAEKLLKGSPTRWERLQEHITRGAPVRALVRESDPRPAITALDDFDEAIMQLP